MVTHLRCILIGIVFVTSQHSLILAEVLSTDILRNLKCPSQPTVCKEINQTSKYARGFDTNGKTLWFSTFDTEEININCEFIDFAIDDPSVARLDTTAFIENIHLFNCKPPKSSFLDAISNFKLTFKSLDIVYTRVDDRINFIPKHFERLGFLKEFRFEAREYYGEYFDLDLLKSLSPDVSLVLVGLSLPPFPSWNKFETMFLEKNSPAMKFQPWGNCDHLRNLTISEYKTDLLPEGWLANCTKLEVLRIENLEKLWNFPKRMLENTDSLRSLTVRNSKIHEISNDFLLYSKNLKYLDISATDIYLKIYDIDLTSLKNLEELYFREIAFDPSNLSMLTPLTSLKYLNLDNNVWIGPCIDDLIQDKSNETIWPYLPSLVSLSLSNNEVKRLCPEWNKTMPSLKYLNLNTSISDDPLNFTFEDIKLIRDRSWYIDVRNNMVNIIYKETDYENILSQETNKDITNQAIMLLSSPIKCNCKWYWFIKTLKEKPNHISLPGFSCIQYWGDLTPKPLADIDPEHIMCPLAKDCPIGCECFVQARTGSVLVNCTNNKLNKVPIIDRIKELVIPNNHVANLHRENFPDSLEYIDFRNNLLSVVTPEVAKALFSVFSRRLLLVDNPILCQCENREFLELLQLHKQQVLDFNNLTCILGSLNAPISTIDPETLCTTKVLDITLTLLCCFALLIIIAGVYYYVNRRKIKPSLAKLGFNFIDDENFVTDKIYDAFVSYSHEDTWFVTDELMPVLEEANGYKLCLHSRDWMAGDWIPTQIARSVQDSRRTIIVLSKNFLSSMWALLEFRTAHIQALRDKQTRVIIILLEDLTSEMKMDVEMRNYLTTNTYVKWGESNFWEKLRKAFEYRRNEKQIIEAGEEVARLYRSDDPPIALNAICNSNLDNSEINL